MRVAPICSPSPCDALPAIQSQKGHLERRRCWTAKPTASYSTKYTQMGQTTLWNPFPTINSKAAFVLTLSTALPSSSSLRPYTQEGDDVAYGVNVVEFPVDSLTRAISISSLEHGGYK